ncbi:cytochrome c [Sphingomonas xanthus]|uniref:Cytochrome c n=1 Tax=Sphingomonas xanthus TaxID=2594473 RepID=A0A516IT56_9SPHN|nr:c-type cytochrome [Sphingomonas xanthus]QDP20077.1 cytochrome c [Sphingomonas xanthus]
MQKVVVLLALASLSACGTEQTNQSREAAEAMPASLVFDGADYKDQAAKLAHGKRLAEVLHCNSCHGDNLQGTNVTADDPEYGDMNAPNLTLVHANYSDADFERLLRKGMPKDGRDLWFMPSESYQFLGDADMAALISYVRSFKPEGKQLPPIRKGKGFLAEVEAGAIQNAALQTKRYAAEAPEDLGPAHARGRDIVRMACTGCHNSKLQGYEGFTPNLDVAAAYTPAELETLLTTGEGKSKPDLGLMKVIVLESLSKMTPAERQAVIGYIKARADRPQQPQ